MWSSWFGDSGASNGEAAPAGPSTPTRLLALLSDGVASVATLIEGTPPAAASDAAAVPFPWEADDIPADKRAALEASIRSLARNRRTFMEPPPKDAEFSKGFALDRWAATAARLLESDRELSRFRWDLVPSKISEVHFWRNFFYRVSLCVAAVAQVPTAKLALPVDVDDGPPPAPPSAASPLPAADSHGPFSTPPLKRDATSFVVALDDDGGAGSFVTDESF